MQTISPDVYYTTPSSLRSVASTSAIQHSYAP